ncbi:MAG: hypothetical protein Fur0025_08970 [Oscillatoriaceae cyanobacterium]
MAKLSNGDADATPLGDAGAKHIQGDREVTASVHISQIGLRFPFFLGNVNSIPITGINLSGPVDPVFS